MSERAFLDFYDTLESIPVNQLGAGSERHFQQRTALYRSLGISPLMVNGSDILEIGPGSGDNALHIASWQPNSFTFIDGAVASVKTIESRIKSNCYGENTKVYYQDLSASKIEGSYDVVLCEGLIPGQKNPDVFLNNVLSSVKVNGVAVFTTVSAVSYLAEICRRVLLPTMKKLIESPEQLNSALVTLFTPGLESLSGMSRKPQDWVTDNILHDWTDRGLFSMKDAFTAIPKDFSVLGSSPSFLQDWRWYKESSGSNAQTLEESYERWSGYLLDYRVQPEHAFSQQQGNLLECLCEKAMTVHDGYRQSDNEKYLDEFLSNLVLIQECIADTLPLTCQSIADFFVGFEQLKSGKLDADFASFHQWFGRGQQYLSLIREA